MWVTLLYTLRSKKEMGDQFLLPDWMKATSSFTSLPWCVSHHDGLYPQILSHNKPSSFLTSLPSGILPQQWEMRLITSCENTRNSDSLNSQVKKNKPIQVSVWTKHNSSERTFRKSCLSPSPLFPPTLTDLWYATQRHSQETLRTVLVC